MIALLMARIQGLPAESVGTGGCPGALLRRAGPRAGPAQLTAWELSPWLTPSNCSSASSSPMPCATARGRSGCGCAIAPVCEVGRGPVQLAAAARHRRGGRGLQPGRAAQRRLGLCAPSLRGKTVWFELLLPDGDGLAEPTVDQLLSMF